MLTLPCASNGKHLFPAQLSAPARAGFRAPPFQCGKPCRLVAVYDNT
jgi:hypothetical protein